MAEGEAITSSSFSESDGDSVLSGSVRYSTDLNEDSKVMSDASEKVDRVAAEVLPYLFEPERHSGAYNESEDAVAAVTETSVKQRNTDWYVTV